MGATFFSHTICSTSDSNAYETLVNEAIENYGGDQYNGTISTCSGCRCIKRYATWNKANEKEAVDLMLQEKNKMGTRDCCCIDLGCKEYLVRTVKKINREYTAKFKQKFVVRDYSGKTYGTFDTNPKADEAAIKLIFEGKDIFVDKSQVKLSGNNTVSNFDYSDKTYTKKPKLKPSPNRKIFEIHKYLIFGWAAE